MQFVYRSHYEGPLSKRIHTMPDESLLAWFQRGWRCDDPDAWVEAELGGDIYGLESIFEASVEENLPLPTTIDELRALLHEHLYVEGPAAEFIRLDEHSLRVRTDDDEVELAYFFLDDVVATTASNRLAYVLHDSWPLPDDAGAAAPFTPEVAVTTVTPAGTDDVTTYAVFLTFDAGESMPGVPPLAFPGVGLPALAGHLTRAETTETWPPELAVIRAAIKPGDDSLGAALDRCNRWPGFNLNVAPPALPADHEGAHARMLELLADAEYTCGRRPEASLCRVSDHLAQLAMHCNGFFGYQQWYLFDSIWAATHPDLAQSLLRYATDWDPLAK